jgi:hypothetical protein
LNRLDASVRGRHEEYVRAEKGGMWLWSSIVPRLDLAPPKTPNTSSASSSASAASAASSSSCSGCSVESLSNAVEWTLSDARKAVAVLRHAWTVLQPLFALPNTLPLQGNRKENVEEWLIVCCVALFFTSLFLLFLRVLFDFCL